MTQDRISNLLYENSSYLPPRHGKDVARIRSRKEYEALCELARTDSDAFWAERARAAALVQALGQSAGYGFQRSPRALVHRRPPERRL